MNILNYPQMRLKQRIEKKENKWHFLSTSHVVAMLLMIVGLASAPLSLVSGRENVDEALRMYGNVMGYSASFTLLSRFFNIIIAILFILIIKKIISKQIYLTSNVRNIVASLGAVLVLNYGLGSLFGSRPGLPGLYLVLTIVALMVLGLIKDLSPLMLIKVFRYVASFMVLGSLVSGIFFSDWSYVAEASYNFGDGASKRLIGFFNHPSALGLYILILLIVELKDSKIGILRTINLIACPTVLVMSLSKTAVLLALIMFVWYLTKKGIGGLIAIGFLAVISLTVFLQFPAIFSLLKSNENFVTLTGRVGLWDFLINSWFKNPIFGNGPAFFSASGPTGFAHAHNIILQAMSDGGLFGMLGLLLYLYALFKIAYRNKTASKNLSVLLVVVLFLFSLIEPVMRVDSFLSGLFFINAFVVLYLCALDRQRNSQGKKNHLIGHQRPLLVKA